MKELNKTVGPLGSRKHRRNEPRADKNQRAVWRRRRLAAIAVAAGALFVGGFAFDYSVLHGDTIRRGVHSGEVDLGGMTKGEAADALTGHVSGKLREINVGDATFTGEELGVKVDADSAVEEAYSVGRRGGIFQRVSDFVGSYLGSGVGVTAAAAYDEAAARTAIEGLASERNTEPKDAAPVVTENGEVEVEEAVEGRVVNVDATLDNLGTSLGGLSGEVALAEERKEPAVSTEEARESAPTVLLGEYKTDYAWDPDEGRQANLRMASEAVDNTMLAPGEEFSFTEQAGSLDYEEAKVFSDGGVSSEEGGGLCQVSSTLFMAANYAGLEITERHQHYAELPYITPGFDATVWFGDWQPLDMKFKNTTGGNVLVREFVDEDGFLVAQILGQESTGRKVVMSAEKVKQSPTEGIEWVTYKKVTDGNGQVISDGVIGESVYSFNPPVPEEMKHETAEPRTSGWLDPSNTTGWAE
ncbi:MAG: Vancomycin B-type resistance protein VanW [uncultured Rubrobacteraceae bacterium]|uniref:Vancomycin B-type resistance protein VanW n=1 Tax=uncultured Rubrobacteraceae bacterium TaxID=349277 RepID=A0A6J4RCX7_9ACTN|nr:MAG: Vancomycin B-type resistance protein VanW [uncultured Rubrobacteraceae bacterium]